MHHIDNGLDIDMAEAMMPGLNIRFAVSIEGSWHGGGASYMNRGHVNHIEVPQAQDCTMQNCHAAAVHDPIGVTVKVSGVVAATVQGRHGH
jgi:hypothetical protein